MMNFTSSSTFCNKPFGPSKKALDFVRQYAYAWTAVKYSNTRI